MTTGKKFDSDKLRMDLLPIAAIRGLAEVLTFGASKYGERNWEAGIAWSRCYSAALRHLTAWWSGEEHDSETSLSHLKHALACLAFLIEYEETHREMDDRPKRTGSEVNIGMGVHPTAASDLHGEWDLVRQALSGRQSG